MHRSVYQNEEEEEEDGKPITQKDIFDVIKKHDLYKTPRLNEILYFQHSGFTKIKNLDQFINLKALWLNNNAISVIEGLDSLINLKTLNLSNNLIDTISGLEKLEQLDTLVLSHNYISRIDGLSGCKSLSTLQVDHNKLKDPQNLSKICEAPSISILNMNDNMIENEDFAESIKGLTHLKVLRMVGNTVTRNMKNYRRRLILQFQELKFLDDTPIENDERRIVNAWGKGGIEAEREERRLINEENDRIRADNLRDYDELVKQGKIERGESLEEPEFPNTDENDENGDAKNGDAKNGDAKNGDAKNGDTKNDDTKNDDTKNDDAKNDIDESGDTVFITKQTNSNIDQGKNEAVLDEADESFINGGNEIEGNDKSDDSKDDID